MKKISYFFGMLISVLMFSACSEGTDFDIEYTPLAPVGGQYFVTLYYGIDDTKTDEQFWSTAKEGVDYEELGQINATLSNTTDFDTDKAWIRVGSRTTNSFYGVNAKVSINMANFTFEGTNVENVAGGAAAVGNCTVKGYCTHNQFTAPSGAVTDYIEFTYSRSDQPGYHMKAVGWKYTGWEEDM